jgi:branched-chain amino acid transport system permease protein
VSGLINDVGLQLAFNIVFYATLALGLNLVVGFAGLLNLGYIAFFGIGAYTYAILASDQFGLHWPIALVIPLAALIATAFGFLFALPTLRLRGDYLAVVTLGFGAIVELIANNAIGLTNGPKGIYGIDPAQLFGVELSGMTGYYYLMLVAAAGALGPRSARTKRLHAPVASTPSD